MNTYYLMPKYDSRASFYNKAMVIDSVNKYLLSYTVPVCMFNGENFFFTKDWNRSQTTVRHVIEFTKQCVQGLEWTKKDIADYISKNDRWFNPNCIF